MSRRIHRPLLLAAVFAATVPAAPAFAQTTPSAPARPTLGATVSQCTTGLDAADRTGVFTGSMPQITRATRMAMRFALYQRSGTTGPFRKLKVPSFGAWVRSEPGVSGLVYDKRVEQLVAPAAYRVRVSFRWYDAAGRVVRRAERTSPVCRQPDLRPDVRVGRVTATGPGPDGSVSYVVTVLNAGSTAIGAPFLTGLSINGVAQPAQRLFTLASGGVATLTFTGPRCVPGSSLVVDADREDAIDEADEADDVVRRPCPA